MDFSFLHHKFCFLSKSPLVDISVASLLTTMNDETTPTNNEEAASLLNNNEEADNRTSLVAVDLKLTTDELAKRTKTYLSPSYKLVSLSWLMNPKNQLESTYDLCFVGVILSYKLASSNEDKNRVFSHKYSEKRKVPYDRIIAVSDVHSPAGSNTCFILVKNGQNADTIFSSNLRARDSKNGFVPGAFVLLKGPSTVTRHFGTVENGVPILEFRQAMHLLETTQPYDANSLYRQLVTIPVKTTACRMSGFYYPKCRIKVRNFVYVNCPCKGYLCDALNLVKNRNEILQTCACYSPVTNANRILMIVDLVIGVVQQGGDGAVEQQGGDGASDTVMEVNNFMSRSFTELIIPDGFPATLNVDDIGSRGIDDRIGAQVLKAVSKANEAGWSIFGWTRRGRTQDQAMSSSDKNGENTVDAGSVQHHISKIMYLGKPSVLKPYLVDVDKILVEANASGP